MKRSHVLYVALGLVVAGGGFVIASKIIGNGSPPIEA
jgi:hypothetical protein